MFKLTFEREKQRMNKSELSRLTGIALTDVCNIEGGRIYPWPGWRARIAKVLGVDETVLFDREGWPRKEDGDEH